MSNISLLKTHVNSLKTLKHILYGIFNNTNSLFIKKNSKSRRYVSLLNLRNSKQRSYALLNANKKRDVKTFYLKALSTKKPSNTRSFLKSNKRKIYITFKNFKKFSDLNPSHLYLKHVLETNTNNKFFFILYCIFNTKINIVHLNTKRVESLFIRDIPNTIYETYPRSLSLLNYSLNANVFSYNYLNIPNFDFFNVNNSLYIAKFPVLNNSYSHSTLDLKMSKISLLWSSFYNTLFLSRTKNMSAGSLFMSINYTDQKHYLPAEAFFADVKSGNYYLNDLSFKILPAYSNKLSYTLALTSKYNSSFFNFLKRRITSTKSNVFQRFNSLTTAYEHEFKSMNLQENSNKIYELSLLYNYLNYFKDRFIRVKSVFKTNLKRVGTRFKTLRLYKRLLIRYKKNSVSTYRPFIDDFQSLPRTRHSFLSTNIPSLNYKTDSMRDIWLKHVSHEESYHRNVNTNTNLPLISKFNKSVLLHSLKNPSTSNIKNINNFMLFITNPLDLKFIFKSPIFKTYSSESYRLLNSNLSSIFSKVFQRLNLDNTVNNNLIPNLHFNFSIFKKVSGSHSDGIFTMSSIPWHYNNIIRFMEFCSGKKILFQFYPFLSQSVEKYYVVVYKRWMTRMSYYERKLGHRFFLEEALHIIHLTLNLHDPKIMCTWLKAIIQRISFWKTRSIFRFLKYLFNQYFSVIMNDVGSKGLKICLRGKISAAGNSRTRTILYRVGKTSHANTSLKVLNEFMTIGTFTGVLGFQIWVFY